MGWLSKLNPIVAAAETGSNIVDKFVYTKQEKAQDRAEERREIRAQKHELKLKQLEINAADAKSGRFLQTSWRPLTAFTCLFVFSGCGFILMLAMMIACYAVWFDNDEMLTKSKMLPEIFRDYLPLLAPYITTLGGILGFSIHTRRKEKEAGVATNGVPKPEGEIPQSLGRFKEDDVSK